MPRTSPAHCWTSTRRGSRARASLCRRDRGHGGETRLAAGRVPTVVVSAVRGAPGSRTRHNRCMGSWIVWTILAAAFTLGELHTNSFYLAPFAVGAGIAAVLAAAGGGAPVATGAVAPA